MPIRSGNHDDPQASIDDMKTSLGNAKFKQLKRYTKDFASGDMRPDAYVDQAAALFERGYGDVDFWSFLPALIESCPNANAVDRALQYMQGLKQQHLNQPKASPYSSKKKAAPVGGGWNSGGATASRIKAAPPQQQRQQPQQPHQGYAKGSGAAPQTSFPALQRSSQPAYPKMTGLTRPLVNKPGVNKNAWGASGGGSQAVVAAARAPPGSVGAAAVRQGPQGGTATKFMAKQQQKAKKKPQQQPKQNQQKKSNKNELRALAFGK